MRTWLAEHWFLLVLGLGVAAGMLAPGALHPVTDLWDQRWAVALSLLLIAWTIPTRSLVAELRRPFAALWAIFLSYGLMPIAGWLLGWFAPADVRIGLILVSCVPCTLSSAVLWTRLAGGNEATTLAAVMGTTFMSWFATTAWLAQLTGAAVALDAGGMMLDLVLTLIVPTLVGQALRRSAVCVRLAERHKVLFSAAAQAIVLATVLKAGVNVGDKLNEHGAWDASLVFGWSIVLAVALHALVLTGGFYSSRGFGFDRPRQIAVSFACSQKTLPVSLVLYEDYFKTAFPFALMPVLFFHVGQLMLDTIVARWMRQQESGVRSQESGIRSQHDTSDRL